MFGFDLVNASHEEIHISAFNELALSLYDQIQIGIVYMISKGTYLNTVILKSINLLFMEIVKVVKLFRLNIFKWKITTALKKSMPMRIEIAHFACRCLESGQK